MSTDKPALPLLRFFRTFQVLTLCLRLSLRRLQTAPFFGFTTRQRRQCQWLLGVLVPWQMFQSAIPFSRSGTPTLARCRCIEDPTLVNSRQATTLSQPDGMMNLSAHQMKVALMSIVCVSFLLAGCKSSPRAVSAQDAFISASTNALVKLDHYVSPVLPPPYSFLLEGGTAVAIAGLGLWTKRIHSRTAALENGKPAIQTDKSPSLDPASRT